MIHSRAIPTCLLLVCLTAATSCGDGRPKRVPVAGKVLIDGEPLTYGFICFVTEGERGHRPANGKIGADGRFTLTCYTPNDGAVLGHHKIQVSAGETLKDMVSTKWHAPSKYADFRRSGLEQEITGPIDDLVINLTWKGNKEGKKPYIERVGPASRNPNDTERRHGQPPPSKPTS